MKQKTEFIRVPYSFGLAVRVARDSDTMENSRVDRGTSEEKECSEVDCDEEEATGDGRVEEDLLESSSGVECSSSRVTSTERTTKLGAGALKQDESDEYNGKNDLYPRHCVSE